MQLHPERATMYQAATRAALLGLMINLGLGLAKLIAGSWVGSYALLSDAINSLGDAFSTVVVLYALRVAQRPADDEHPYGHTRAEAIAASNVAVLIILSAVGIGWETLTALGEPRRSPPTWTLGLAAANVVIKELLYRYKAGVGHRTGSAALIANAWDHRNDALCALAVLLGLASVRYGGPWGQNADRYAALVVVAAIVWTGVKLFRSSASELMDLQADDSFVRDVRGTAADVEGVQGVEKLWIRKSGLEYFVDIHIEVDSQLSVATGHGIGHQVKDRLLRSYPNLRDVLVHLEPYPHIHATAAHEAPPLKEPPQRNRRQE